MIQMLDSSIMDVLNVNDVTTGATPQTHTPAYAIQLSQTMNMARLRKKGQNLVGSWRRRTRLEANLVIAYAALLRGRGERFRDLGEFLALGEGFEGLKFDVKIASKTELPVGFIAKLQFALEGKQAQMMDNLAAVEFTDYPISPDLKHIFEIQRQTALLQAEIQLETVRAQRSQMGAQGAQMGPGQSPMSITAGQEPASPAAVPAGPPGGQLQAPAGIPPGLA